MFGERKTLQDQLLNITEDVEMNNLGYFSERKGREWLRVGEDRIEYGRVGWGGVE